MKLAPGTWRVRASHAGLATAKERIRLQLWMGEPIEPRVAKRWSPAPPRKKTVSKGRPRNAKQAAQEARRGHPDIALDVLVQLAGSGDPAAAASAAEILAFRGRWKELVSFATALVANPKAVYAGNVFTDMCCLLRRAARKLNAPDIIEIAASKVPAGMESRRDAVLLRDYVEPSAQPGPANRERFEEAVRDA